MEELAFGPITMDIDLNLESNPTPEQLTVAIANGIDAMNLDDSSRQPFTGNNLYDPHTWDHVLVNPPRNGKVVETTSNVVALDKSSDGGFYDCSICLDLAKDPVVTYCGHLFCWPCLYKWLYLRSSQTKQCPVCKGEVTDQSVIPIYGGGGSNVEDSSSSATLHIPRRPTARRVSRDSNARRFGGFSRDSNAWQIRHVRIEMDFDN